MGKALECIRLAKNFGGVEAINSVSLGIEEGERRAIIGPNGAGKTTLFRLISGEYPVTSGQIRIFGKDVTDLPAHKRAYLVLGRTFQVTNLFFPLTVIDNLILAQMGLKKSKFSVFKPLFLYKEFYQKANEVLDNMGIVEKRDEIVKNLAHGEQRQIEIAMALITNPKILLLDEPTAGLSEMESKMIARMIKDLDDKITMLVIEHDMDVAFELSNSVTVMNLGEVFAEGTPREIKDSKKVQEIYLGEEE